MESESISNRRSRSSRNVRPKRPAEPLEHIESEIALKPEHAFKAPIAWIEHIESEIALKPEHAFKAPIAWIEHIESEIALKPDLASEHEPLRDTRGGSADTDFAGVHGLGEGEFGDTGPHERPVIAFDKVGQYVFAGLGGPSSN